MSHRICVLFKLRAVDHFDDCFTAEAISDTEIFVHLKPRRKTGEEGGRGGTTASLPATRQHIKIHWRGKGFAFSNKEGPPGGGPELLRYRSCGFYIPRA